MARRNELYVGAAAPVTTKYDLTVSDVAFDLTTIEAGGANLLVRFANSVTATWLCSTSGVPPAGSPTASAVRLTRLHAPDDVPEGAEGIAKIRADVKLTGSAEPIRGEWMDVNIVPEGT